MAETVAETVAERREDMGQDGLVVGRKRTLGRWWAAGALGALAVLGAACSSGASSSGTTQTTRTTAATSGTTAADTVAVAHVGSLGTVLVDGSGKALYHFTPDGTGPPTCNGGCATIWPPVLVTAGTSPVAGSGLHSSDLGTVARAGGTTQVTYKGMPLYTYSGDTQAGEAKGQGVANTWFVISTSASGGSAGAGSTTTTKAAGSGGYGY